MVSNGDPLIDAAALLILIVNLLGIIDNCKQERSIKSGPMQINWNLRKFNLLWMNFDDNEVEIYLSWCEMKTISGAVIGQNWPDI